MATEQSHRINYYFDHDPSGEFLPVPVDKTLVFKFGGTSVASADSIAHVAHIVSGFYQPDRLYKPRNNITLVVSAMAGVTDGLIETSKLIEQNKCERALSAIKEFELKHLAEGNCILEQSPELALQWHNTVISTVNGLKSIANYGIITPEYYDFMLSRGEFLNAQLVALSLNVVDIPGLAVDAADILTVQGDFGNSKEVRDVSYDQIKHTLVPLMNHAVVPVVGGFYGRHVSGDIAILGRGGSDLSATLIGVGVNSDTVIFGKEVDGVYDKDPKKHTDAILHQKLSFAEADELAGNGAKIFHRRAMQPILEEPNDTRPDIWVVNTALLPWSVNKNAFTQITSTNSE